MIVADTFSCTGVILVSREFKDKDRMLSILTPDRGLISVCAKGCGKPGSKTSFAALPFLVCDFVISISHGYYYLKEGNIIEANKDLMNSFEALTVASHISDCLIDAATAAEDFSDTYKLAVYALYSLSHMSDKYLLIYSAFNWRLLSLQGQTVIYRRTKDTGNEIEQDRDYIVSLKGGDVFERATQAKEGKILSGISVKALNFFASCDIKQLFAVKASEKIIRELAGFTTDYISLQFDKSYEALTVLETLDQSCQ